MKFKNGIRVKDWHEEIDYESTVDVPQEYLDKCKGDEALAKLTYKIASACPDEELGRGQEIYDEKVDELNLWRDDMPSAWHQVTKQRRRENDLRFLIKTKKVSEKPQLLVEYLVGLHNIKTLNGKQREIFVYRDGYYKESENYIRHEVQRIMKDKVTESLKREVLGSLKDKTLVFKETPVDKKFINLDNGIYDIKTQKLLAHSPEYFFTWKLPVSYDPACVCENIQRSLQGLLREDDIRLLQEWMGYCLYRDYGLKKAVILVGEQNTGKSTVIKLFEALVGRENVSGVSLDKLTSDKYSTAHLRDKFINLYDDLSYKDVNDNGVFKMATGNGLVTGEFKYGDQFHFQNHAKLTFACNKIPSVKDTHDDAYFGRWMIIEFNRQIEKKDPNIFAKMSTDKELSGLLNFALEGLNRIIEQGEFSYNKTEDEIKEQMLKSGSPVAQFAYDYLIEEEKATITKDHMIEYYRAYAKQHGLPSITKENLGKKLPKYAQYIDSGKEGARKHQYSVWRNVQVKEGVLPEEEFEDFDLEEE